MGLARLGVNIDHIATLRKLRDTPYPNLMEAAEIVQSNGAALITVHLREDRRHIQDEDVALLRERLKIPLNLEMAASESILNFGLKVRPEWACIVPEKRQERTTEGGLDLKKNAKRLAKMTTKLKKSGIRVSYFIEPSVAAVNLSCELGADAIELHTGKYGTICQKEKPVASQIAKELERIEKAALKGKELGIQVHAGHGLDEENVRALARMKSKEGSMLIEEFNIGHSIVCRAVVVGLERAVREMLSAVQAP